MLRIRRRSRYSSRPRGSRRGLVIALVSIILVVTILTSLAYFGHRLYRSINQGSPLAVTYNSVDPSTTGQKYFGPINIDVKHIPQEIKRGKPTQLSVGVGPGVICSVLVNGQTDQAERGLYTKEADSKGSIVWEWDVRDTVRLGSWPIQINCKNPQHKASLDRTIMVVDAKDKN